MNLEACINFLQHLIQTQSRSGEEEDIAKLVISEMRTLGYDEVNIDNAGNVIGKIEGKKEAPPIMFNTHLDHVDVGNPEEWPYSPFGGEKHDESIWGRGAVDIKGPLAAQVYGVASILDRNEKPPGDIYVTSVVQEEVGGVGALHLLSHLTPPVVIVGEPSSNILKKGHRGRIELLLKISGYSVHASVPDRGVNPLKAIANFIQKVKDIEMASDNDLGKSTVGLTQIYSDQKSTNVIPSEVYLICDWRNVPKESEADIIKKIKNIAEQSLIKGTKAEVTVPKYKRKTYTGIEMEIPGSSYPFKTKSDNPVLVGAKEILRKEIKIKEPNFWGFSSDGGHFSQAGLTVIGFGPGDESLAHTVNEHIPISQMEVALKGYSALANKLQIMINK